MLSSALWGTDWERNAVRGGLGRVLLSPSVPRDMQRQSFARHKAKGVLTETVTTALVGIWLNRMTDVSHLAIPH